MKILLLSVACLGFGNFLQAAENACGSNKACQLYVNLTSVLPSPTELAEVEATIASQGIEVAAINIAKTKKEFQTVLLKTFAEPWTDSDGNLGNRLNDTILTLIKVIMEERDFREVLYGDFVAIANTVGAPTGPKRDIVKLRDGTDISLYHPHADTQHYRDLENSEKYHIAENVVLAPQVPLNSEGYDPAGVMTTNGFGRAAFNAGTNRRAVKMLLREATCLTLSDIRDAQGKETYINRDVAVVAPDGSVSSFKSECKTCHNFIDQLVGTFVWFDIAGETLQLTYERVMPIPRTNKLLRSIQNPNGYIIVHDEWRAEFTDAQNAVLGWPDNMRSGFGASSLGKAFANTEAFAKCQPQKAFTTTCGFEPREEDRAFFDGLVTEFKSNGYNLKPAFIKSAIYCAGGTK